MKKVYIKPTSQAYQVKSASIICGSGGESGSLTSGNGGTPPTPTGSKGICGESKIFRYVGGSDNDEW